MNKEIIAAMTGSDHQVVVEQYLFRKLSLEMIELLRLKETSHYNVEASLSRNPTSLKLRMQLIKAIN